MNRIDRVTAILVLLQTKQWITASEMAQRFNVSVRTIYRDVQTLCEAGVPIGSEAGKGYFIVDGYHLSPVMFTLNEAGSMLLAGKLMEKMGDQSAGADFRNALDKIRAILPPTDKDYLQRLDSGVEVFYSSHSNTSIPQNTLSNLQQALAGSLMVELDYHSIYRNQTVNNRLVEPIVLCFYSMNWHLIAFCRLRNEYRDFRVDRIRQIRVTDKSCPSRDIKTAMQYFSTLIADDNLVEVVLNVDDSIAAHLSTSKYYYGFVEETQHNGYVQMRLLTSDLEYTSRWLLTFGEGITIISPKELTNLVSQKVRVLASKFL